MDRVRLLLTVCTVLVLVGAQAGAGFAPGPQDDRGVDSREEVEEFVDDRMAEDLRDHDVSGATVAVVKDDELLFAEGYGYADRRNRTPVDPNHTLFRVGSVSKLFAWTAVMQGVEDGRLDRDADVNRYLDEVEVPDAYDRPVTLDHLATHTAGFEEQYRGTFVESPEDVRPLGEALRDGPARVRPPGEVTSYSNYGAALAGHVAARQSDAPTFGAHVDRRIFGPLEMDDSTFAQPVPADLRANLSAGYRYEDGEFRRGEFETVGIPPAGSASATATDMSKFMRAHLNEGQYGDSRVLSATSTREMHRQQFANHPDLNGVAFGFYEQSRNGERIIGHGGDTELFHSGLWLFPERDLGVFVSYNSPGGAAAREDFFDSFVDEFYPAEGSEATDPPVADASGEPPALSAFEGVYRQTRMPYTSYEKVGALGADFRVRADGDALAVSLPGQEPARWVRTGPTTFEEVDGDGELGFRVEDGEVTYLFFDRAPVQSFERLAWWQATPVQLGLLGAALALFATAVVAWPVLTLRRAWKRGPPAPEGPRTARMLAGFAGLLGLGFVAGFAGVIATDQSVILYGSALLDALLVLPAFVAVAALGAVALALLAWRERYWGLLGRVHYALLAVALVVFCWQLYHWNLLGGAL
ncbi:beta-lactamase family protein [Halorussus salilacus]|uniref:serine hydrolase domain-containing protein n=1 Tax=Halorussus salilacus TaxID=2953750 RepID=UPI00209E91B8|nr:serine hydrolase domain-containing protein [Halorussus salilacus]USZ67779.1 beta-lactamase family protein [Halorussus salilacus]